MLRSPKKTKYKYTFNRSLKTESGKGFQRASKDSILIKSKNLCLLTPQQREACRRILAKPVRENFGHLNIRFFPNVSLSKKPLQTRMGKGKGRPDRWVAPVKKGTPLLEISGRVKFKEIRKLYARVAYRLPVYSKLVGKVKRKVLIDTIKIK